MWTLTKGWTTLGLSSRLLFQDLEHDVLVLELLAFVGVDLLRLGVLQVLSE